MQQENESHEALANLTNEAQIITTEIINTTAIVLENTENRIQIATDNAAFWNGIQTVFSMFNPTAVLGGLTLGVVLTIGGLVLNHTLANNQQRVTNIISNLWRPTSTAATISLPPNAPVLPTNPPAQTQNPPSIYHQRGIPYPPISDISN